MLYLSSNVEMAGPTISTLEDRYNMLQQVVNALTLGSVYALFALGYSMVYGILTMLNFAHGEVFMIGGFVAFAVQQLFLDGDKLTANPVVIILCMLVAAML